MATTPAERLLLRKGCTIIVPGFRSLSPAAEFREMAAWCEEHGIDHDVYGEGPLIEDFEIRIAGLLGKEAAAFMPSGVMAQLIALRLHSQDSRSNRVGLHPTSHLLGHEEQSYSALLGLTYVPVGEYRRPLVATDLAKVPEALAALIVELPIREAGGQLPSWDELEELKRQAAERGLALHMDGARLWESLSYYGKEAREVAQGFESVYVSMYKGIGGIAGALLAGARGWIEEARIWRRRMGGTLVHQSPMIISAARRFDERLVLLPQCRRRAVELAEGLNALPGLSTVPEVPHTNMFHLYCAAPAEEVLEVRDQLAREEKIWLVGGVSDAEVPGWSKTELTVGDSLLSLPNEEVLPLFRRLLQGPLLAPGAKAA
jgi:threonine aldolase